MDKIVGVRLDCPIQFLMPEAGPDGWVDCVASEDGRTITFELNGVVVTLNIDDVMLRSTPMVWGKQIEPWFEQEIIKLHQKKAEYYKRGDALRAQVKFRYPYGAKPKPEKKVAKKEYQIRA